MDHVRAHGGGVACLHYSDAFPAQCFSGGSFPDDTLKVWDCSTFACERTLLGGGGCFSVNAIAATRLDGGAESGGGNVALLFSVDDSGALRAWDIEAGACIVSRVCHELGIRTVDASDGLVITGYPATAHF